MGAERGWLRPHHQQTRKHAENKEGLEAISQCNFLVWGLVVLHFRCALDRPTHLPGNNEQEV
eukprot:scaffold245434_cov21-Tisochrysis_lutea.AAC.2